MKYIIVKALLGFGDRLESLMMYIKYALEHNLSIYVDWTDSVWSHGTENFYTYFKLINMPVLNCITDIPDDAKVYPSYWQGRLQDKLTYEIMNKDLDLGILKGTYDCDVLVCSSHGYRELYNNLTFFANVFRVVDPRIIKKIDVSKKIGIHLRGTDRATRTDKGHRMAGMNIRMANAGVLQGTQFIAVSDDLDYIKMWTARYPHFPLLSNQAGLGGREGNHNKPKESLSVSKDILNVNMLTDFFILMRCSGIISTSKDSRFTAEALRLHRYSSKILEMIS